ncbi:hypothetical protein [Streptomyces sp. NPDC002156]
MVERLSDEEESWDWDSDEESHTNTPRDPAFTDPSVLEQQAPR